MRLFEWLGKASDAEVGETATSGTGQSGTVAIVSTASLVVTNALSYYITQQTSSGSGEVRNRIILPVPLPLQKMRATWLLRQSNTDANFGQLYTGLYYYDGTNANLADMVWNSNAGATEEIQYRNSSNVFTNTGFNYPADAGYLGASWHVVSFDVDFSTPEFTRLRFDEETDLVAKAMYAGANATYPCVTLETALAGQTSAANCSIDSITLDTLE